MTAPREAPFRPAPLPQLAEWVLGALERGTPVMGIPRENFATHSARLAGFAFGRPLAAPYGVAAGPHTQLAQNIVAAWLCGARFIELKTVQILDHIEVARPCIDAADRTYNCEWSQELTLDQSFDEYLKAWVLLHAIAHQRGLPSPGAVFTMSVGYDLAGVQSDPVQRFIGRMRDAGPEIAAAREALHPLFPDIDDILIPDDIAPAVTLSTMHGCPPAEIERIARYLLEDCGLPTWIKVNPTLLGADDARRLLGDTLGYDDPIPDEAFAHDPAFDDMMGVAERLSVVAREQELEFGLKLTNTLPVRNTRTVFPASEQSMYMSGRPLYPLVLSLAQRVTERLDGSVPLSYCGGADALNIADLIAAGLGPVTVCSDLLRPGGYARLAQYGDKLEEAMRAVGARSLAEFASRRIDAAGGTLSAEELRSPRRAARRVLATVAAEAAQTARYAARPRPPVTKSTRPLGAFDCVAAPCVAACPAHQDVPEYMRRAGRGQLAQALEVILDSNPLPMVTGGICTQQCAAACVRNHYDEPVQIRAVKYAAAHASAVPVGQSAIPGDDVPWVAVVGAGPAGLSAATFLRRGGVRVRLYDGNRTLGGMPGTVVPVSRLDRGDAEADVARALALGVEVHAGVQVGRDVSVDDLRRNGASAVVLAVGAARGKRLGIDGEHALGVRDALSFLRAARDGESSWARELGDRILVLGGGNTAMDAARTAKRLAPAASVTIVYRRTRAQMPAQWEEILACDAEGIAIAELRAPDSIAVSEGRATGLRCRRMMLGMRDATGRAEAIPVDDALETLDCTTILVAIGQQPEPALADALGLATLSDGRVQVDTQTGETSLPQVFAAGDVVRGAASIIHAIADGRRVAETILARLGRIVPATAPPRTASSLDPLACVARKGLVQPPAVEPPDGAPDGFALTAQEAAAEARRCLDCDRVCDLCVTVCPNRALQAYAVSPRSFEMPRVVARDGTCERLDERHVTVQQDTQIVCIADFCNACGNCATFCPTAGDPQRDKPRVWLDADGFATASGDAYRLTSDGWRDDDGDAESVTVTARLGGAAHTLTVRGGIAHYAAGDTHARWNAATGALLEVASITPGEVDLLPAASLMIVAAAAAVLPLHSLTDSPATVARGNSA